MSFGPVDFHGFHAGELQRRLVDGNGALAAADDLVRLGPLAFRMPDGAAYTYRPTQTGVEVVPGEADATTVVDLAPEDWAGLVHDLESPPALLYSGRCRVAGDAMRFVRWEPGLRAMYHGRPIFHPDDNVLRDRHGERVDPTRTFGLDDDDADMADFLKTTGFLVLKSVFPPGEVEAFRAHAETLRAAAKQGDKRSWWGRNADGEAVLCRVTDGGRVPSLRRLYSDARLLRLAGLSHVALIPRSVDEEDGISLLIKNPDMTEGLGDLPWHRDCGMGGHASMCPVLVVSIFLESGRPENGELRVLPGSHEASCGFSEAHDAAAPEGVGIAAEPGDVSLHYGDIMHVAPAPTGEGPFRRCLLLGFKRPDSYNHRGLRSYNDVLLSRDDGQIEHLQRVAARS